MSDNAALGLPESGPPRFASLDQVRGGLKDVGYLADESISGVVYLADRLAKRLSPANAAEAQPSPRDQVSTDAMRKVS